MASHSPVVLGYKYRLKRCQRYFDGLRMLPQWGGAYFEPYFRRTFEAYTTLWRYQQANRPELEHADGYNMQRCEIGEIASKIGQLFYFYYLRTSDLTALSESFTFYEAIRTRQYFCTTVPAQVRPVLLKQLRFYARYVVVALLKNYRLLALALLRELTHAAEDAQARDLLNDTLEWTLVLRELNTFLKADRIAWLDAMPATSPNSVAALPSSALRTAVGCSYRLQASQTLGESFWRQWQTKHLLSPNPLEALKLTEAILVTNKTIQVKFSELTLDLLRVMQSLEWEARSGERPGLPVRLPSKPTREGIPMGGGGGDNSRDSSETEEEQALKARATPPGVAHSAPPASCLFFGAQEDARPPSDAESVPPRSILTPSSSLLNSGASSPKHTGEAFNPNPRKAVLYHPTYAQLSYVLSTAMMEMENRAQEAAHARGASGREAMLIFLSGDAAERPVLTDPVVPTAPFVSPPLPPPEPGLHSQPIPLQAPTSSPFKPVSLTTPNPHGGGLFPSSLDASPTPSPATPNSGLGTTQSYGSVIHGRPLHDMERDRHSIYLEDLLPFTRNPCFVIVDSEASALFNPHQNMFGQPLVCLFAPEVNPLEFSDAATQGSLFALFLTQPILAFWVSLQRQKLTQAVHHRASARLHTCFAEDLLPMLIGASLDPSYEAFLTNDFTRLYILRFIFCKAALVANGLFASSPQMLPTCFPALPPHLFTAPSLTKLVEDLTAMVEGAD
eukprot:EG_transcript_3805